jgi:hypothetical protein
VQPFKVTYTRLASTILAALEKAVANYRIGIENVNLVDNEAQYVEYYNVRLPPATRFGLITEEFASFVLEGRALAVAAFDSDPHLGKYGRVVMGY